MKTSLITGDINGNNSTGHNMTGLTEQQRKLLEIDKESGLYDKILSMYPDASNTVDAYLEAGKSYFLYSKEIYNKDNLNREIL